MAPTSLGALLQDPLELVISFLEPGEGIGPLSFGNKRLHRITLSNTVWHQQCAVLWTGKLVPKRFEELRKKGEPRAAYWRSLKDSKRVNLTRAEVLNTRWSMRFKEVAGPVWQEQDPWWAGQPARRARFGRNGLVFFEDSSGESPVPRLSWRFVRLSDKYRAALQRKHEYLLHRLEVAGSAEDVELSSEADAASDGESSSYDEDDPFEESLDSATAQQRAPDLDDPILTDSDDSQDEVSEPILATSPQSVESNISHNDNDNNNNSNSNSNSNNNNSNNALGDASYISSNSNSSSTGFSSNQQQNAAAPFSSFIEAAATTTTTTAETAATPEAATAAATAATAAATTTPPTATATRQAAFACPSKLSSEGHSAMLPEASATTETPAGAETATEAAATAAAATATAAAATAATAATVTAAAHAPPATPETATPETATATPSTEGDAELEEVTPQRSTERQEASGERGSHPSRNCLFGERAICAKVMGRGVPTYCVRREPKNWGWILESCWVIWTSWDMPAKDDRSFPELVEKLLPVTVGIQRTEAMSYNHGFPGQGPSIEEDRPERFEAGDRDWVPVDVSIEEVPANPTDPFEGELMSDKESDEDEEGIDGSSPRPRRRFDQQILISWDHAHGRGHAHHYVILRYQERYLRFPRVLLEELSREEIVSLFDDNRSNTRQPEQPPRTSRTARMPAQVPSSDPPDVEISEGEGEGEVEEGGVAAENEVGEGQLHDI